ncbi:hypothetical protein AAZX31_17G045600 [Glycine max]|uniref:Pectinesterase inhibitor domain-containing protein n=2 Tax=Glycine subgen. Soja TaxID=1462606 RepID=I1MS50_SOYBN|nr:pectinesterase inhibitor 3 [Glycine max]XP_028209935.1 pectinesterase inhibitor 3-like [Glycine soja]KAG4929528.1 hypothetical protein JHK86_046489 [Glycine max]KAG4942395.1 hypothetical protein JHK85_047041 [Glycine max]KAG5096737.1 hypothetical protein JHK82_046591 [Glycine max]KAG5101530.1 hypothetical protein JHK84_046499 [Glycine max]KAH1116796.1 hypothetical protein GYH30_046257 [Glycine max]|eukprot:XP_003551060.1 pectinesterase inhibitor 3 [Glycine max]
MQTQRVNTLALFLLLLLSPPRPAASMPPRDPLRSSCAKARYPTLCFQTLSNFSNLATKPLDLAQAAIKVSLARTRTLSVYFKTLNATSSRFGKRQRVAVSDCVEQISDSVTQLINTLNELQHLRAGTFQWQMSNAQTWTSAALTNGDTCLSGFNDGGATADGAKIKLEVKRRITDVAMLTSNALYLINRLGDDSVSGKPRTDFGN